MSKQLFFSTFLRNCKVECSSPITGKSRGTVPSWIQGSLVRNGPGLFEHGNIKYNHLFDGLALIHKFAIKDAQVTYQSRFVRSHTYETNMKANRVLFSEFGTPAMADPCDSLFSRLKSRFVPPPMTDNTLVNVIPYGSDIYALTETVKINVIDLASLDVVKRENMSKYFPQQQLQTQTAHPHVDVDGTVYNIGTSFGYGGPTYCIFKTPISINGKGYPVFNQSTILGSIKSQSMWKANYYHSFGMTDQYIIFVEQPLFLSLPKLLIANLTGKTLSDIPFYDAKSKARFHVINKNTGQAIPLTYETDAFFLFHHINAYEDDGHLVVDICAYKDAQIFESLRLNNLAKAKEDAVKYNADIATEMRRYVLPLDATKANDKLTTLKNTLASAQKTSENSIFCKHELLHSDEGLFELPTINYRKYNGKKYRYFYATGNDKNLVASLIKVDTETKSLLKWSEKDLVPSEAVILPKPGATSEDEAVALVSLLHAENENAISLLILDCKTFEEIARAEFSLPSSATGTFHGNFVA